jgi:SAM-dependent methyltransferase
MKLIIKDGYAMAANMDNIRAYDNEHWDLLKSYEDQPICKAITKGRIDLVKSYCRYQNILDIGCGTGYFIKKYTEKTSYLAYGFDILQNTITELKKHYLYINPYDYIPAFIKGVCLWDVMEHLPDPMKLLDLIPKNVYTFISMPIYEEITQEAIIKSKHYRPNEHLHYWSDNGLIEYMSKAGFDCLEKQDFETKAGREDIYTYVFKKQ